MQNLSKFLIGILVFSASFKSYAEPDWKTCWITTDNGLERFELCAQDSGDLINLKPEYFKKIVYSKDNLAGVYVGENCYWLNRKKLSRKTFCFDNGPDNFTENYARYIDSNGRFGFINKDLKIVITPKFDFVFPFKNGKATFCMDCKKTQEPNQDHSTMTGGRWGMINKTGKVLKQQR